MPLHGTYEADARRMNALFETLRQHNCNDKHSDESQCHNQSNRHANDSCTLLQGVPFLQIISNKWRGYSNHKSRIIRQILYHTVYAYATDIL